MKDIITTPTPLSPLIESADTGITTTLHKSVEASIVMTILKMADIILKNGDIICQRMGITTQQWLIMLHLAADPNIVYIEDNIRIKPILASDLADALHVSRPNITNLINSLTDKGLVQQVKDKRDGRKKFLILTAEGLKVLEIIEPYRQRANERLLNEFSAPEKEKFLSFLRHSLEVLNEDLGPNPILNKIIEDSKK